MKFSLRFQCCLRTQFYICQRTLDTASTQRYIIPFTWCTSQRMLFYFCSKFQKQFLVVVITICGTMGKWSVDVLIGINPVDKETITIFRVWWSPPRFLTDRFHDGKFAQWFQFWHPNEQHSYWLVYHRPK